MKPEIKESSRKKQMEETKKHSDKKKREGDLNRGVLEPSSKEKSLFIVIWVLESKAISHASVQYRLMIFEKLELCDCNAIPGRPSNVHL